MAEAGDKFRLKKHYDGGQLKTAWQWQGKIKQTNADEDVEA